MAGNWEEKGVIIEEYAVIGMDGQILKRGHDLKKVICVLERKLIRAVV